MDDETVPRSVSYSQEAQALCPQCGRPVELEVWLIVDGAERPDLLARARAGSLHTVTCPHCGHEGQVDAPLLVYQPPAGSEPAGGPARLLFSPAQQTSSEQDREQAAGLLATLRDRLGDAWQDKWVADMSVIPRNLLPAALSDDPEAALRRMAEEAAAEVERLRREEPETYAQLEEVVRQMMAEAMSGDEGGEEEDLADRLIAWINTPDWAASEEYLQEHAVELLTDEAEAELERLRQINPDSTAIPEHQELLRRARQAGIAATYADFHYQRLIRRVHQSGPIGAAVARFLQADDEEAAALLQSEAALLLSLDAGELLRQLAEATAGDEGLTARLRARYEQWQRAFYARVGGPPRRPGEPHQAQPERWQEYAERQPVQAERGSTYTVIHASQCAIGDGAMVINKVGRLPLQWRRPAEGRPLLARIAVGRETELEELHRRLESGHSTALVGRGTSVALRGDPAIGKTTLAAMYVERYGDHYPGGVLWLEVGPDRRTADSVLPILQRIATYAYAADLQAQNLLNNTAFAADAVRALLAGHEKLLVVIDDVWDEAALYEIQAALPADACVLLTTRIYQVAYALEKSAEAIQPLDVLSEPDARALLQRGAPGLSDDLADRVAAGLGRHALALTLAAGTLAFRKAHRYRETADELLRRVAKGEGFGDLPRMDQADRLSQVEIAFKYSYDELGRGADGAQRQAWFRALGAFAQEADFDPAAAAAVTGMDLALAEEFLLCLDGLGLIREKVREQRWQQHALLRAYALSLQTAEERIQFAEHHADHYIGLTQRCYESKPRDYDRVEREFAQIQHAFAWCKEYSPYRVVRLTLLLDDFMRNRGRVLLLNQWLQTALSGAEAHGDRLGKANTLKSLGDLERRLGNVEQARAHYDAALPLYEAEQDRLGKANTLKSLGDLESRLGNVEQARAHYDAALPLYEAEQDRLGKANTLKSLGDLESRLGNVEQARAHYDAALPLYEAEQDPTGKMNTWISLARLEASLGHLPEAAQYYQQTFRLAGQIGFADHPVVQGWRQEYALLQQMSQPLATRLIAWIQTPDWGASEEYLHRHAAELLTDEAEAVLAGLRQANPESNALPQHQLLLRRCRQVGIQAAYQEFHQGAALAALLAVDSLEALEQALAQHPLLLELATLERLGEWVTTAAAAQPEVAWPLLARLGLLLERYNRAHTEGVDPVEQARFVALHQALLPAAEALDADLSAGLRNSLVWALNTLGNAHAEQGDHAAAITAYSQAIGHAPQEAMLYRNRASEYLEMRQWAQAEADIAQAAALEPDAPRLAHLRQTLAQQSGER